VNRNVSPELSERRPGWPGGHRGAAVGYLDPLGERAMEELLTLARQLRPTALDDHGLVPALASQVADFGERTGIRTTFHRHGEAPELSDEEQLVLYRVTQEALTNVARHSGADHAELRLSARNDGLTVTVSDRGRGLRADGEPGTGIRGMRERAALIGATLDVGPNEDGVGCAVTLHVEGVTAEAHA